jgi:hypothetical protein
MSEKPVGLTPAQMVRHYVQQMLDNSGDGWHLAQYVMCMGLERVTPDGTLECTPWVWAPPHQAEWMTDGLLAAASDLRLEADIDTD